MKKILALLMAVVMVLGLTACGGSKTEAPAKTETKTEAPAKTETKTEAPAEVKPEVVVQIAYENFPGEPTDLACNECHAPHNLLAKIPFKAKEGLRDFLGNVQGKEAPLSVNLETRDVVQANCMSCHRVTNQDVMMAKPYCVDCHRGMAHQKKTPVSFREAADE